MQQPRHDDEQRTAPHSPHPSDHRCHYLVPREIIKGKGPLSSFEAKMADSSASENELDRLKRECAQMMTTLKQLEKEELDLQCQNTILAREAMICGFDPKIVEPPPPKRRRPAAKKKTASSAQN